MLLGFKIKLWLVLSDIELKLPPSSNLKELSRSIQSSSSNLKRKDNYLYFPYLIINDVTVWAHPTNANLSY